MQKREKYIDLKVFADKYSCLLKFRTIHLFVEVYFVTKMKYICSKPKKKLKQCLS